MAGKILSVDSREELTSKFEYGDSSDWEFVSESLGVEYWRHRRNSMEFLVDRIGMYQNGIEDVSSVWILDMYIQNRLGSYYGYHITRVK